MRIFKMLCSHAHFLTSPPYDPLFFLFLLSFFQERILTASQICVKKNAEYFRHHPSCAMVTLRRTYRKQPGPDVFVEASLAPYHQHQTLE